METRPFGSTLRDLSLIGQGTWQLEGGDRAQAIAALQRGLDLGMTHIDTAEMYGNGIAEQWIAKALGARREQAFLVSKVLPQNASRGGTRAACEASLRRLETDRLDCYLLHWPGRHPLEQTIEAFEELQKEGKIASWGLSNFDATDLERARQIAGDGRIACNQVLYHLEERGIEHEVIPWCEAHGVAVVGYSPFGSGRFPKSDSARGRVLQEIAAAHHASPRQVALRFLVRRPSLFAIPRTSRPDHAADNAAAGSLHLSDAELARIDEAFPRGKRPRQLPTL